MVLVLFTLSVGFLQADTSSSANRFTIDFFKAAYDPTENAILSPISVQTALSMLYPIAGDRVAAEMQRILHLPANRTEAIVNIRKLLQAVRNHNNQSEPLKMLSKLYHDQQPLNPELVPLFRDQFDAEIEEANFRDTNGLVQNVNQWTEQATAGLIKDFLKPEDVNENSELVLLNCIALNATWKHAFDPDSTYPERFFFQNGDHDAEMMSLEKEIPFTHLRDYRYTAIELPYSDEEDLSMVLILPRLAMPLKVLVEDFSEQLYRELDTIWRTVKVEIMIPKFKVNRQTDAKRVLTKMGLAAIFEEDDFNAFKDHKSFVGDVRQTAFINVDERGTEAAAATYISFERISRRPRFVANRPFLYLIRKRSTKDIIFIGHYSVHEE